MDFKEPMEQFAVYKYSGRYYLGEWKRHFYTHIWNWYSIKLLPGFTDAARTV